MTRQRAFTLIEVLVSMAVFAVLSALAYGALSETLDSVEFLNSRMDRLQAVQRTVRLLSEDLQQLSPRPIRDELGEGFGPALDTDFQSGYALELTHGGWSNPVVLPRSTQQRSAYRIEDDELIRYHWNVLDRTLANEPLSVTLLDGVESIQFRFMLANGEWLEQWPPQTGALGARQRPRAVEFLLTLEGEGEIRRLLEVAP
ncbi:MAG: type II secretion system minor pseudopilin GspJ [Woeseiaceae bacterium]|nr:type II secretion system minor pseudopilin GspJ [Woeseiaceae bacterium]